MQIRFKHPWQQYDKGTLADVESSLAERLVGLSLAELVEPDQNIVIIDEEEKEAPVPKNRMAKNTKKKTKAKSGATARA